MEWSSIKWRFVCGLWAAWGTFAATSEVVAQVQITEIMFDSLDIEPRWEWVEIKNTSAGNVDLHDWVFGDRASRYNFANISNTLGNTVVPAGGVAVIYNSTSSNGLGGVPSRFTDAWGDDIQLIPVNIWPSINNNSTRDRLGLWSSYAAYNPGAPATPTTEPAWANAVFEIDFHTSFGFPTTPGGSGRSIAWNGTGSATSGANWVASSNGVLGAYASSATSVPGAAINNVNDSGTPGLVLQGGTPPIGKLVVTEIMYNPASAVSGNDEAPFEFVEILNNTGSLYDFTSTPLIFDDLAGVAQTGFNVTTGSIANGSVAVLYNDDLTSELGVTIEMLEAAWEPNVGTSITFIPVTNWPALNNSSEAIGFWDDLTEHGNDKSQVNGEGDPDPTLWTNTVASVIYDSNPVSETNPWPDPGNCCSIYLNDLGADPNVGANWIATGGENDTIGAANPNPISVDSLPDHVGGDVGSPGFVPGSVVVGQPGDFNDDGIVDAEDYTVWRDNLGGNSSTLNGNGSGAATVVPADYELWKANFGEGGPGSGSLAGGAVPEPTSAVLLMVAIMGLGFGRRSMR
jgi:hypothetical protein